MKPFSLILKYIFFSFNMKLLLLSVISIIIFVDVRNKFLTFLDFEILGRGLVMQNYFILSYCDSLVSWPYNFFDVNVASQDISEK